MKLAFTEPIMHNGESIQCIDEMDIESEVELWKSSITCFVLGVNPPFLIIKGFARDYVIEVGTIRFMAGQNRVFL